MIRKYQRKDTDAIVSVWYQSSSLAHPFLEAAFMEKEKRNVREMYLPNTETWVFEKEGAVVGFISMMGNEVGAIFVRPNFHGQGIGRALMDTVAKLHPTLEVEVFERNKLGRAFYDKYGFEIVKNHIHEETKQSLLRMEFLTNRK